MNDNEIIKAWKCCSNVITSSCKECPLHLTYNANCVRELMRVSLDLYNREKAEVFNLKEEIANLKSKNDEFLISNEKAQAENARLRKAPDVVRVRYEMSMDERDFIIKQAKSEAYREFADKWNNLLLQGRSRLVVQPQIVMMAFELAIACTNTALEELTEGEMKP